MFKFSIKRFNSEVHIDRSDLCATILLTKPQKRWGHQTAGVEAPELCVLAVKSVKIVKWDKSPNTCYVIFYIFIFLELILRFVHLNYETRNFSFIL